MKIVLALIMTMFLAVSGWAQQSQSSQETSAENPKQSTSKEKKPTKQVKENPEAPPAVPEAKTPESSKPESGKSETAEGDKDKEEHYDVSDVPPVVTHHQISLNGRQLAYTATTGRLPIKRPDGKIEAQMFFVAYTLDGQDVSKRPVTFAFNGGPGSASVWLHMGALGRSASCCRTTVLCRRRPIAWRIIRIRCSTAATL